MRTAAQKFIERRAYNLSHAVVANAEAVRRQLIKEGVRARKIAVVYNGLDMNRLAPSADVRRDEALASFGLPAQTRRRFVTIVANMRLPVKDQQTFLRAAGRVREAVPEAAFVLAGEGELADSLRALAAQLGLERDAFFIGRCERVAELLAVSDVCVLSSKAEGFSNAILEYMAAARAVVATDVGGAREVVVEGETGHLVQVGDDAAMAERIVSLLKDPARAREMGGRGRRALSRCFFAGDVHTNEAQCAPSDGNETRRFAEDEPTQEDRDGWNEVRGRGETPGLAARERIGPRREGDRGREDAEEEEPANSAEWHGFELVHQNRRERQADNRPHGTAGPRHLQRRYPIEHRLFRDDTNG